MFIPILVLSFYFLPTEEAIIPIKDGKGRLSLAEWNSYNYREPEGKGTYAFGYDIEDPETNNIQFRNEEKLANGSVVGSYGYLEPNGDVFILNYIADHRGYRASFGNPLKLSFLRPPDETEEPNSINNDHRSENLVSPNDITILNKDKPLFSSPNQPHEPFDSVEESNAFYYPQNILQSIEFNQNTSENPKKEEEKFQSRPQTVSSSSALEENNSIYFPQNILDSPDFNKHENSEHKLIFQKNLEKH